MLFFVFFCGFYFPAKAQINPLSNWKSKTISVSLNQEINIDSLNIEKNSFSIAGFDSSFYKVDYEKNTFIITQNITLDSIQISYRTLPFSFSTPFFKKDKKWFETNFVFGKENFYDIEKTNNDPFLEFGNIDYNGAFGRILSFGNNQDITLNSQFNLQMQGDLGDSIKIVGAITDNTIPFQPEGNTQQIQEFDRVFIKLERKKSALTVGDFDIKKPPGYFINFFKRVQGGFFSTQLQPTKNTSSNLEIGTSIAKGKFVRNVLLPLDGNQGPYKLTGPNGEQFFIVLAGSERVYIDGIQIQRGENLDYIIDYNTAEIIFMPRRLITKDLRIVVEFEFSDRNFLNSLMYLHNDWQLNKKLNVSLNVYANQDSKNQSILADLDANQKSFLNTIGDSIQNALYPSISFQDTFSNQKILYKKIDTLIGSNLITFYRYSTNPDSAKYQLNFTFVGEGNGNYIQSVQAANGRVYEWKAPNGNTKFGNYEPVIVLVTPKKQQLISLASTYQIDSNKNINIEGALSNTDPNTFSDIGNENHLGKALKLIYNENRFINIKKQQGIKSFVNFEYVDSKFKQIERFRNVEFARDWNLQNEAIENEAITQAGVEFYEQQHFKLNYHFTSFIRGKTFDGKLHNAQLNYVKNNWNILAIGNVSTQNSNLINSIFYRPNVVIQKTFPKLKNISISNSYLQEKNISKITNTDSLSKSAFAFNVYRLKINNSKETENQFDFEYMFRDDYFGKNNQLTKANYSNTFTFNGNIATLKNQQVIITSSYRQLFVSDTLISKEKAEESLLGRIEYNGSFLKNAIQGNIVYEFGNGQELKKEFAYVQVPAGQGVYVWRDYNNDNVPQLNEFEVAIFQDEKRYIRVFTITNQYVKAKYSNYTHSINITPRSLWNSNELPLLKKAATLFSYQSSLQISNRFLGQKGIAQYNPFLSNFNDDVLISNNASIINSIFFNRFSNLWGIDYINTKTNGKVLMNYGIDSRQNKENLLRGRYNINSQLSFNQNLKKGSRLFLSPFLDNRNYLINYNSVEPAFTYLMNKNKLRFVGSYRYEERKNTEEFGSENAFSNSFSFETKYNMPNSGSVFAKTTFSTIKFNGNENSGVGYIMLDGLQKGKNWLWQVTFDKKISNNIEMSIEYEGRKTQENAPIHIGRASVRAVF
ncbi:MAG: hypothetical protein KA275_03655 [Chitinophagaceae bacterium]|nr:hypothetical protein [Chitinophagaceae bacterium]